MLTSTLVSPNAINLKLPSSSQSAATSTRQPLKISVTEQTQYLFNGQVVGFEGLKTSLQGAIRQDGRLPKEITVILDIHPSVPAQKLVDVVEIITNAGTKMVLSTQAKAATPS
jgi:biopolymer transport protein ExbD